MPDRPVTPSRSLWIQWFRRLGNFEAWPGNSSWNMMTARLLRTFPSIPVLCNIKLKVSQVAESFSSCSLTSNLQFNFPVSMAQVRHEPQDADRQNRRCLWQMQHRVVQRGGWGVLQWEATCFKPTMKPYSKIFKVNDVNRDFDGLVRDDPAVW